MVKVEIKNGKDRVVREIVKNGNGKTGVRKTVQMWLRKEWKM